jgi:hypothetical protein
MAKKSQVTTRVRVRSVLRLLWLRSPERRAALKRDHYTCQFPGCNKKQSRAKGKEVKVQVHHMRGIVDWEEVIDFILASGLFRGPDYLITRCEEHHKEEKGG